MAPSKTSKASIAPTAALANVPFQSSNYQVKTLAELRELNWADLLEVVHEEGKPVRIQYKAGVKPIAFGMSKGQALYTDGVHVPMHVAAKPYTNVLLVRPDERDGVRIMDDNIQVFLEQHAALNGMRYKAFFQLKRDTAYGVAHFKLNLEPQLTRYLSKIVSGGVESVQSPGWHPLPQSEGGFIGSVFGLVKIAPYAMPGNNGYPGSYGFYCSPVAVGFDYDRVATEAELQGGMTVEQVEGW